MPVLILIPANVGLQDQNLGSIINQYNTMLIERKRLLRTSSENNPAVININTGIESMRHNVQTTVNSVLRGLQIAQSNLERQARKFEGRISSAPQQEKEFLTISRQQEIKATLYIMLMIEPKFWSCNPTLAGITSFAFFGLFT